MCASCVCRVCAVCVSPGQSAEKPASFIHSSLSRRRDTSLVIDRFHSDFEWLFFALSLSHGSFTLYNFSTVGFLPEWGPALLILRLSFFIRDRISTEQREMWIIRVWHSSGLFHLQIWISDVQFKAYYSSSSLFFIWAHNKGKHNIEKGKKEKEHCNHEHMPLTQESPAFLAWGLLQEQEVIRGLLIKKHLYTKSVKLWFSYTLQKVV